MYRFKLIALITLLLSVGFLIPAPHSLAQQTATEYQVKAVAFYRFIEFSRWPENSFSSPDSPIQVCILGENPFGTGLDFIADRNVFGRNVALTEIPSGEQFSHCHALFIGKGESQNLPAILSKALENAVLTVSDIENFAEHGGIIGLTVVNNKIRFQVNRGIAVKKGLRLSSSLLEIAERVIGEEQ